jgi:hypothetical protein
MAEEIHEGDHVRWKSPGGQAEGPVLREITEDPETAGRTVGASEQEPQYEVRSDTSGGTAVDRPGALQQD